MISVVFRKAVAVVVFNFDAEGVNHCPQGVALDFTVVKKVRLDSVFLQKVLQGKGGCNGIVVGKIMGLDKYRLPFFCVL